MATTSCKPVRLAGVDLFWEKSIAGWFVLISQANRVAALSILLAIELQTGIQLEILDRFQQVLEGSKVHSLNLGQA
jgi:hypothetical protein